jgi:hypothetical protein
MKHKINRLLFTLIERVLLKRHYEIWTTQKVKQSKRVPFETSYSAISYNFSLNCIIHEPLRWPRRGLHYRTIYSWAGSGDRSAFKGLELFEPFNKLIEDNDCMLVSVIGSSFFLDLVMLYDFSELVLFDENINEHAKVSALINELNNENFDQIQFEESLIMNNKNFMPYLEKSNLTYSLTEENNLVRPLDDIEGFYYEKGFPLTGSIIDLPRQVFDLDSEKTQKLVSRLRKNLDKNTYFQLPSFDAGGKVVVLFLSNIPESKLTNSMVYDSIQNSSSIKIIRKNLNHFIRHFDD